MKPKLTKSEQNHLSTYIAYHGLTEAMLGYVYGDEIKDKEFHKLRGEFEDAYYKLQDYLVINKVMGPPEGE
jgi:4-aminobutyrate aminotransferase-like enzyme